MSHLPILLIAGPTASGKTALAIEIAQQTGAEIINADSMQVYAGLPILSAMPTLQERGAVPHHLFGDLGPEAVFSVGQWLRAVLPLVEAIQARGRGVIIVGGTGLYFNALVRGLAHIPPVPDAVRDELTRQFDAMGEVTFRRRLADVDQVTEARIAPSDRQRLVRALSVYETTGRALTDWQADTHPALADGRWRGIVLDPPRAVLRQRCAQRFDLMLQQGALDEVVALKRLNVAGGEGISRTLGFGELSRQLAGELDVHQARDLAVIATQQFAKRQATWFRNQMTGWRRIESLDRDQQVQDSLASTA